MCIVGIQPNNLYNLAVVFMFPESKRAKVELSESDDDDSRHSVDGQFHQRNLKGEDNDRASPSLHPNSQHLNNNSSKHNNLDSYLSTEEEEGSRISNNNNETGTIKEEVDPEPLKLIDDDRDADGEDEDEGTAAQKRQQKKEHYLKALAAEGLRVGRHGSRYMKPPMGNQMNFGARYNNGSTTNTNAHNHHEGKIRRSSSNNNTQNHNNMTSPNSTAVDTLLRVFPTKRPAEIEAVLGRCGGDVLKSIELLLLAATNESNNNNNSETKNSNGLSSHHHSSNNNNNVFTSHHHHHNPRKLFSSIKDFQDQQMPMSLETKSKLPQNPPPGIFPSQELMSMISNPMGNSRMSNNAGNNGNQMSLMDSSNSPFPFFGPYAAAAAAAAAAHRFNSNRRFIHPSLLNYSLPGLHRPPGSDFYGGPGGPLPLVTAAAAAAMNSAAVLNLGVHSHHHENGNSSSGVVEHESCTTPPTSGSDRASYSE